MAQILNTGPKAVPASRRLMLVLMGGAGLILLGGGGALLGLNSHLTSLQAMAHQKEQEVGSSVEITKRYETTEAAYTQTQSRIQYLETSVTAKSYVPTLLGQLQTLAATTHLTVTAVRPGSPPAAPLPVRAAAGEAGGDLKKTPPPPPYDTLPIDVDVIGTYADTATFLYSLTRFPKIISVTAVQMHPGGAVGPASSGPPPVTTNLKLVAFMFREDAAGAQAASVTSAPATTPPTPAPATAIPPASVGTISGAAGRAATGAAGATKAVNARAAVGVGTL